jgi:hypothetical protein
MLENGQRADSRQLNTAHGFKDHLGFPEQAIITI